MSNPAEQRDTQKQQDRINAVIHRVDGLLTAMQCSIEVTAASFVDDGGVTRPNEPQAQAQTQTPAGPGG